MTMAARCGGASKVGLMAGLVAGLMAGLMVTGCTGSGGGGAVPPRTDLVVATEATGGSACDWLTDETISNAVPGNASAEPPADSAVDVWSCIWRNGDTELMVRFDRFTPSVRSVEATLLGLGDSGDDQIEIVAGRRGAFLRPGVWYGETPLEQYGMATIRLTHIDGSEPEQTGFERIVSSVFTDVAAAAPHVPW